MGALRGRCSTARPWRRCAGENVSATSTSRRPFPETARMRWVPGAQSVCGPSPQGRCPWWVGARVTAPPPHRVTPGSQCQDPAGPPAARVRPGDTGEHTFAWCPVTWGGQRPHPQPYRPVWERPTGHTGCESRGGQALGSPRRTPSSQDPCPGRGGAFHTPSPNITAGTRLWTDPCRDPNAGHTG